jgi:hypothetical protein
MKYYHYKWLITLTMITLSSFHCNKFAGVKKFGDMILLNNRYNSSTTLFVTSTQRENMEPHAYLSMHLPNRS